jgi:hypothetical protein
MDPAAKQRARLAFLGYERALIEGDGHHARAARDRFLEASRELALARQRRTNFACVQTNTGSLEH